MTAPAPRPSAPCPQTGRGTVQFNQCPPPRAAPGLSYERPLDQYGRGTGGSVLLPCRRSPPPPTCRRRLPPPPPPGSRRPAPLHCRAKLSVRRRAVGHIWACRGAPEPLRVLTGRGGVREGPRRLPPRMLLIGLSVP